VTAQYDVRGGGRKKEYVKNILTDGQERWNKWYERDSKTSWVKAAFNGQAYEVVSVAFKSANDKPARDPENVKVIATLEDGTNKEVGSFDLKFDGRWDLTQQFFLTEPVNTKNIEFQFTNTDYGQIQLGQIQFFGTCATWEFGTFYKQGDIVCDAAGLVYYCKPWPEESWCQSYAPGSTWSYLAWDTSLDTSLDTGLEVEYKPITYQNLAEETCATWEFGTFYNEREVVCDDAGVQYFCKPFPEGEHCQSYQPGSTFSSLAWDTCLEGGNMWNFGTKYAAGEVVCEGGEYYTCKTWPEQAWCQQYSPSSTFGDYAWNSQQ